MRVLVIGAGGREHAITWRLARSRSVKKIFCAPGNPGMAEIAKCVPANTIDDYLHAAVEHSVDLTVVGPEAPLVEGIVDRFRQARLPIVGPSATAARLEGSKAFAKDIMTRAGVPTARYVKVNNEGEARAAFSEFSFPLVLKADGLAGGKGVVIAQDAADASAALPELLSINGQLVIEEFLQGDEVSFIVLSDGRRVLPFAPTQDHKAVFDGDRGPNTGGMGAYSDSHILTVKQSTGVMTSIIDPVIAAMAELGSPFTGFLYAGLMMTAQGPRVLEFNVRLGDPETQALLLRFDSDFGEVLKAAAEGDLRGAAVNWSPEASVCVVMTAQGYPGQTRTGDRIHGFKQAEETGSLVFQAGTKKTPDGVVTAGGRVLGVTASGFDLPSAIEAAYRGVEEIRFDGMHFRRDIGRRGVNNRRL